MFIIRAMALLLREETDEYLRMRLVEQSLVATGILLTVATLYGFLNAFDLAPRIDAWAAVPLWAVGPRHRPRVPEGAVVLNNLKVLRAARSWSQQDLAERLEVSRQSVNAIETGKYDPSLRSPSASPNCSNCRSRRFSSPRRTAARKPSDPQLSNHRRISMRVFALMLAACAASTLNWSPRPQRGIRPRPARRPPSSAWPTSRSWRWARAARWC